MIETDMPVSRFAALWMAGWALPLAAGELVRVGVVELEDGARVTAAARNEMRLESVRVLGLEGVGFDWRESKELERGDDLTRVVVVRFASGPEAGITLRGVGGPMGVTAVQGGRVLPFVTVDVERVRDALSRGQTRMHPDAQLGRALGRVLAHELYHALSGSLEHDQEGVAKASLSSDELSLGHLRLSAASRRRLINALGSGHQAD